MFGTLVIQLLSQCSGGLCIIDGLCCPLARYSQAIYKMVGKGSLGFLCGVSLANIMSSLVSSSSSSEIMRLFYVVWW